MNLTFQYSHARTHHTPAQGPEVAIWGRSNAGKSTFMNALTGLKLARCSRTPGRTQMIQVFKTYQSQNLVDLPGYGYAQAGAASSRRWEHTVKQYLTQSQMLCGLLWIFDAKHPITEADQQRLEWFHDQMITVPIACILNKIDQLNQSEKAKLIRHVQHHPVIQACRAPIFTVSAKKKQGITPCQRWLEHQLVHDQDPLPNSEASAPADKLTGSLE